MKILYCLLATCFSITAFSQDADYRLDKEYKVDKLGTLDLNSSDAKVFITGSARATVHVKIERIITTKGWTFGDSQQFRVDVSEENGSLKIREKKSGGSVGVVGMYHETYRIDIEAPDGMSLVIHGDDGDYYIKNIHGAVDLSLDDADVELAGCKGNKFKFRMDDGDLKMDQGKGTIEIDGDDTDVKIYNASFTGIQADVDDGDILIETSLDDRGNYYFESQDGLIALTILSGGGEFDIHHDDGQVISNGNFKSIEKSEHASRLVLAGGTAKINMRADDARVKLAVR
jgi:hypothetical protein